VGKFMNICDIDEMNRSIRDKLRLALTNRQVTHVTRNDWNQDVMKRIIEMNPFLRDNIKINFLGVTC